MCRCVVSQDGGCGMTRDIITAALAALALAFMFFALWIVTP